jgi:2-C-methyl-D-erythritol 2,4-cyclodiphosphate synthase
MVTFPFRVGMGVDAHALVEGRPLILGGVHIPHPKGLLGHSDADVLTHVIIDAVIGAAGLGSIGMLFPDTDPQYKGIASTALLANVVGRIRDIGFEVGNIDAVVVAQAPKIMPHRDAMRECLAMTLGIDISAVSLKATTTERLGFEGREEGISAHAVALIYHL